MPIWCDGTALCFISIYNVTRNFIPFPFFQAENGAGRGEATATNVETGRPPQKPQNSDLGLILGVSIGGGVLLILLLVGGFIAYKKKNNRKPPRSTSFTLGVIPSDNDSL